MFKIAKSKLPELLKAIAAQQELFLPVNNNGQVNFAAWFEGCNADIETLKTVKSPKDMFFPQSETLYTVKKEQHKLSVEPQALADQNFVAFGMKACDIQGIKVLDKVFLAEPVDTFYRARRELLPETRPAQSCVLHRQNRVLHPGGPPRSATRYVPQDRSSRRSFLPKLHKPRSWPLAQPGCFSRSRSCTDKFSYPPA